VKNRICPCTGRKGRISMYTTVLALGTFKKDMRYFAKDKGTGRKRTIKVNLKMMSPF
jgi:hypothetical protein